MKAALQRPGMAEVIYVHREDALRAVDVYNNRQLDGLPMHCNIGSTFEGRRDNHSLSTKPRCVRGTIFQSIIFCHFLF